MRRFVRATVSWRVVATGVVVAALIVPAVAIAHRGDGVFTLAEARDSQYDGDVAMLPDGSIVGAGGWRITPDGRRSSIPGFGGTGFAATADGGVLALQGGVSGHRIVRWTPGVGVSVAAGTGAPGFGGDGGPAREALLNLDPPAEVDPTGIVARPDGGYVFTDTSNHAIRAVDAAGMIRTIAGGSAAMLRDPLGLAATPDGGYLVTEDSGRVRRIRPDAAIETVARLPRANDVVVFADGTAVISEPDSGRLWRLEPGSPTLHAYLRPERPTDPFDFAARSAFGDGIALDSHGGLLAGGSLVPWWFGSGLRYVPNGRTPWTLVGLRDTRTSRRGVTAVIEATQPGMAILEITRRERIIASVRQPVAAGHSTLRAVGPIRNRWYDVRVRLEGTGGATARDQVPIYGARTLTVPVTRTLLGGDQGADEISATLGRDCRAFGRRRVDCLIVGEGSSDCHPYAADESDGVASITLGRSGVVLRRDYRCGRPRFRLHPRFIASHGVQRLSRRYGGTWYPPS